MRHEGLPPQQPHLAFALADVVAHRQLSDRGVRELSQDPVIEPPCRVPLLARRVTILVQHPVDEGRDRAELRLGPGWVAVLRRQRTGNRLAHQPPMNPELRGDTRDRANPKLMLATKLLEQIHFGSPVHARPPDPVGRP